MTARAPITAWVADDTDFPKKGQHSVGVARQYAGQVGEQDNCQLAVSLSISTLSASLPTAYELYLPEVWSEDPERRRKAGVPDDVVFRTKPLIAAEQIRQTVAEGVPRAPVVADAAYGNDTRFRQALLNMGAGQGTGIRRGHSPDAIRVASGQATTSHQAAQIYGPPEQHTPNYQPILAKHLAAALNPTEWRMIAWRDGTKKRLPSRSAARRVRPTNLHSVRSEPLLEQWLLIEWLADEAEPTKYWLGSIAANTRLTALVATAVQRWIIERDYEEPQPELGLGHYEGRGWRGFPRHATLCIGASGLLIVERSCFYASARARQLQLALPKTPPDWRPRGASVTS
jgi:SRSO17 transposase